MSEAVNAVNEWTERPKAAGWYWVLRPIDKRVEVSYITVYSHLGKEMLNASCYNSGYLTSQDINSPVFLNTRWKEIKGCPSQEDIDKMCAEFQLKALRQRIENLEEQLVKAKEEESNHVRTLCSNNLPNNSPNDPPSNNPEGIVAVA